MDTETLKAAVKSVNDECEKKLAEMTEDEKNAIALKCVPELAVGAKILVGIILEVVKNGNITDDTTKDVVGFVGGLASSVQKILGFNEEMATHDLSTMFGVTQMMKNICDGKCESKKE